MNASEKRTGRAVEIARYFTDMGEERLLLARRIDGTVCVYDSPTPDRRRGRTYRVDAGIESRGELAMLRRDYLAQADRLGDCPMSRRALRRLAKIVDERGPARPAGTGDRLQGNYLAFKLSIGAGRSASAASGEEAGGSPQGALEVGEPDTRCVETTQSVARCVALMLWFSPPGASLWLARGLNRGLPAGLEPARGLSLSSAWTNYKHREL